MTCSLEISKVFTNKTALAPEPEQAAGFVWATSQLSALRIAHREIAIVIEAFNLKAFPAWPQSC